MPYGDDDGMDQGTLRKKYEAALAELRDLKPRILRVDPKYSLVEDQDFAGLKADDPLEEWEARAKEVQGQRTSGQKDLLKKAGLSDEQIAAILSGESVVDTSSETEGMKRIASVASEPAAKRPDFRRDEEFTGTAAIHEYFARKDAGEKV